MIDGFVLGETSAQCPVGLKLVGVHCHIIADQFVKAGSQILDGHAPDCSRSHRTIALNQGLAGCFVLKHRSLATSLDFAADPSFV